MKQSYPEYLPVEGKTYTLFGDSGSTSGYYEKIRMLAEKSLQLMPDTERLIKELRKYSGNKRRLKRYLKKNRDSNLISSVLNMIDPQLKEYTTSVEEHLRTLPLSKLWDRRLATSREQYHLYMLEIELTNRYNKLKFLNCDRKIALMPYCLQDFSAECKSEKNGFDYQCKHCSGKCFQNQSSVILKKHNIEPYIWMEGSMKQLAKYTLEQNQTFGVLGIACIPELSSGMRDCGSHNIPVVGLPLNANRCIRWFGEFFPNSVDLEALELLLTI